MHKPMSAAAAPLQAGFPGTLAARALESWRGRAIAVVVGSAFVAVCAHIAVPLPWTPVPMTMQPFGVLLVALLLGPGLGCAAMVAYLLEGAAGLPVFVPGLGGLLPLGPGTGYLLSYPLVALVAGSVFRRGGGFPRALLAATLGELAILACGAAWLAGLLHLSAGAAFRIGVLPFAAGDALKVLLAAGIAGRIGSAVGARRSVSLR